MTKNKKTIWQSTSLWVISSVAFVMFLIVLALSQNPSLLKTKAIAPTTSEDEVMGACYSARSGGKYVCTQKTKENCKKYSSDAMWNRNEACIDRDTVFSASVNRYTACDVQPTPLETGVVFDKFKTAKIQCAQNMWEEARWICSRSEKKAKAITENGYYAITFPSPPNPPGMCRVQCTMIYECVPTSTPIRDFASTITPTPPPV